MISPVKLLLILLFLPLLIVIFFTIVIPAIIILLVLSLFIPSIRLFHSVHIPRGQPQEAEKPEDDSVVDVECTVVDSTSESVSPDPDSTRKLNT